MTPDWAGPNQDTSGRWPWAEKVRSRFFNSLVFAYAVAMLLSLVVNEAPALGYLVGWPIVVLSGYLLFLLFPFPRPRGISRHNWLIFMGSGVVGLAVVLGMVLMR